MDGLAQVLFNSPEMTFPVDHLLPAPAEFTPGELIDPYHGACGVQSVQAVGGSFKIEGLDKNTSAYLLRCEFDGVMYTETVPVGGRDSIDLTFTVFESRSGTLEGVHVIIPHLAAAAENGNLQVEQVYELHNHVEPAVTFAGEGAQFEVYIPEDKIEILRNNEVVKDFRPGSEAFEVNWTDNDFNSDKPSYYYTRVLQGNGEEAISSPVWIENTP